MALFGIAYDLMGSKHNVALWNRLNELGAQRALSSFYLVSLSNTAAELRNDLQTYLSDQDRLIVIEFDRPPSVKRALPGTHVWIEDHV